MMPLKSPMFLVCSSSLSAVCYLFSLCSFTLASGNHLQYGTSVEIKSAFSPSELVNQYKESLKKKNTRSVFNDDTHEIDQYDRVDKEEEDRLEISRLWWAHALQQIPFFVGRLVAHGTGAFQLFLFDTSGGTDRALYNYMCSELRGPAEPCCVRRMRMGQ